jgi:predicted amidohydrolase
MHIYAADLSIVGGTNVASSKQHLRGKNIADPCFSPIGYLGLSNSYDLRFPELYRKLTLKGAQVLLVPSAFTAKTGASHWETLVRTRAIEN